jgi:hypothetical protein
MANVELYVISIPGADPRKWSHGSIHLLATEDMNVLHLVDTDDPRRACRIAQQNFPDFDIVVFSDNALDGPGCRVTHDLPVWARRWRLEFAIAEGSCAQLGLLPMGPGRDLFFQGLGAFVKWRNEIAAMKTDFVVSVRGSLRSEFVDSEAEISIGGGEPPQVRADVTHRSAAEREGRHGKRFGLVIGQKPDYLVPLFEQAFELPGIPLLRLLDESIVQEDLITEVDLGALGLAIGALAVTAHDSNAGRMRLESELYDLEARVLIKK